MALVHSPTNDHEHNPRPLAIILPIFDDESSDDTSSLSDRPIRGLMVLILDGSRMDHLPDDDDSFHEILNRLMQLHEPKPTPTSSTVLESLPTITSQEALHLGPRCCVCLEDFEPENTEQNIVKLECSHPFHKECVVSWLKDHNTCPVCRYEFQTEPETPSTSTESTENSSTHDDNTQSQVVPTPIQTQLADETNAAELLLSLLSAIRESETRERESPSSNPSDQRSPSTMIRIAMLSPPSTRPPSAVARAFQWVRRRLSSAFSCFGTRTIE